MTVKPHLANWDKKYNTKRPRRLLALTGGGIRGIMSLEILLELETQLAEATGKGDDFRLGRYFDFIAGTSTGAIITAALSIGMSVSEVMKFYIESGEVMFEKTRWLNRAKALYKADPITEKMQKEFALNGIDRTLGAEDLHSMIMIVTRNATTDSTWPLTNNHLAKYNNPKHPDCNLDIPLWQLVRASSAAPVYFPPEDIEFRKDTKFRFVDGGMTPYNDPGFLLYRYVTSPHYKINWPTGEDKLMLISVGTGSAPNLKVKITIPGQVATMPGNLMNASAIDQDINCRHVGRCVAGAVIDRELGDMIVPEGSNRAFLYARYNPELTETGIEALELTGIDPESVQTLDSIDAMGDMRKIGKAYAEKYVDIKPFQKFI